MPIVRGASVLAKRTNGGGLVARHARPHSRRPAQRGIRCRPFRAPQGMGHRYTQGLRPGLPAFALAALRSPHHVQTHRTTVSQAPFLAKEGGRGGHSRPGGW